MPDLRGRDQLEYTWRFGSGTNTRASEDEIRDEEDAGGVNFQLDLENSHWRPRKGFELIATATNGSAINGYAQLLTSGGTLHTLIQAGTDVYKWDLSDTFTDHGNVSASARLRGPLSANWGLGDKALISDLALQENVKEWDGTTFQDLTTGLTNLKAKYLFVENERVWAANLVENAVSLPQVIAASAREDETSWTVTDRPTSALGDADPFQIPSPDLRPINGLVYAFGTVAFSTRNGSMYRLLGETSRDFGILPLYSNSAATGDEAVVFVGNDVFYGRQGVIESLSSAESLADVSADDLSRQIYTDKTRFNVQDVAEWTLCYDQQRGLLYCFPDSDDRVYVFYKAIWDEVVQQVSRRTESPSKSPWAMWETQHPATFQPSCVWGMLDANKRYQVYMGDTDGNIYRFNSGNVDGDSTNIKSERLSRSIQTPRGALWDVEGHVIYRASTEERVLRLRFEYGGISITNQDIFITLPAIPLGPVYGGGAHYGGSDYYGTRFVGRLSRQNYTAAGRASRAQIRATIEGQSDFSIAEIGLRFKTGSQP